MSNGKNVHVVPDHSDGDLNWKIKTEGSEKAYRIVENKAEAETIARQVAINNNAELIVHNKDGRVSERNSYGHDPFPPRG